MIDTVDRKVPARLKVFLICLAAGGAAASFLFGPERSMPWILVLAAAFMLLPDRTPKAERATGNPHFLRIAAFVMFAGGAAAFWLK